MGRVLKFMGTEEQVTAHQGVSQYYVLIAPISKFNISKNKKILVISFWDNLFWSQIMILCTIGRFLQIAEMGHFCENEYPFYQAMGTTYI